MTVNAPRDRLIVGSAIREAAQDVDGRVARALVVERVLTRLGWFVLIVGVATLALIAWEFSTGDLDLEQSLKAALGTALATVLSGAVAYGSGTNVGLSAARLALSQTTTEPEPRDRAAP